MTGTRRRTSAFLVCTFTVCVAIICLPITAWTAPAAARPNVILIMSDDQGYGDLSLHGNPHLNTPHLDQLAAESFRFERFFVSPLCAPTRASLLTGRYSLRTGARGVSRGEETMRSEEVTIAEMLRDAGYRTGMFGKWHNGEYFPHTPRGQGFDEMFGFNLGHWNNYFDTTLRHNGRSKRVRGYITDVLTDAAISFVATNSAQPFFCYLAYNVPHSPFQVPDAYFNKFKDKGLNNYLSSVYGMCENMDHNVGRLLDKLNSSGLRTNTIVIFLSDNGANGVRFNAGMRGTKGSLHEGGSRVPFFLRWPARYPQPRVIHEIAAHIDLLPTLRDLCGVRPDQRDKSNATEPSHRTSAGELPLDGRSLVALLDGRTNDWPDRLLFTQHRIGPRAERSGAVRTQRFRTVNTGLGWELFDMQRDPGETRDVSAHFPTEKKRLIAAYELWWKQMLAGLPKSPPAIPIGYAQENPIELLVPQSEFTGGIRFSGKYPNNAWLINWTNTNATIQWDIEVVRAGKYAIKLSYLCKEHNAGAELQVTAGDSRTRFIARPTRIRQVPSPDRVPRKEVHEMEWPELAAGTLDLRIGPAKLILKALTRPGDEVIQLKSISLFQIE